GAPSGAKATDVTNSICPFQFLRCPLRLGHPPGHQYWNEASSCAADQAISLFCGLASRMNRWYRRPVVIWLGLLNNEAHLKPGHNCWFNGKNCHRREGGGRGRIGTSRSTEPVGA